MVQLLVFAKNVMKFYNLIIIGKEETYPMTRMKELYEKEVAPALMKKFEF